MKKQVKTNSSQPVSYKAIVGIFVFLAAFLMSFSQNKVVSYTAKTQNLFSIPENTNIKLITDMDMARLDFKEHLESCDVIFNKDYTMTFFRKNLQEPEDAEAYAMEISNSVSDVSGIELYNYNGKKLYTHPHESGAEQNYFYTDNMLREYGIKNSFFEMDIKNMAEQMQKAGFAAAISENATLLTLTNDSVEIYIDFKNLAEAMLFFKEDELVHAIYHYYVRENGFIIPSETLRITYPLSENGVKLQKIEEQIYLYYAITENGNFIVERTVEMENGKKGMSMHQYEEVKRNNNYLKIYPNPAQNHVIISVPEQYITAQIEILTMDGISVLKTTAKGGEKKQIDIASLTNGTYLLRCTDAEHWHSAKFVKN